MTTERDPAHGAALKGAFDRALELYDATLPNGYDAKRPHEVTAEDLEKMTPEQKLAWAHLVIVIESAPFWTWNENTPGKCAWCIEAAGGTQEAFVAAETFPDRAAQREHVLTCTNMPLIAERDEALAALAKARIAARAYAHQVNQLGLAADDNDPKVMATAGPIGAAQADMYIALGIYGEPACGFGVDAGSCYACSLAAEKEPR